MSRFASVVGWVVSVAVFTVSNGVHAEQAKTHDGWFFRAAGGAALAVDPAEVKSTGLRVDGTLGGSGMALDLMLGGSPTPGLVLGGGAFFDYVPTLRADDMKATVAGFLNLGGDVEFAGGTFVTLAPFIDYYPDAHGGLHVTGAVGVTLLSMGAGTLVNSTYEPFRSHGAVGAGALGGLGYEWWVSNQWSLGILGRVTYAAPSGDDGESTDWQHHLWLPALLVTATMN